MHEETVLWCIAGEEAVQAVLSQRTNGAVTHVVVVALLFEYLLTGSWCEYFLCHIYCCLLRAKLMNIIDICNYYTEIFCFIYTFLHKCIKLLVFRCLIDVYRLIKLEYYTSIQLFKCTLDINILVTHWYWGCSLIVSILETICFKGRNNVFQSEKQFVSHWWIPNKLSHLHVWLANGNELRHVIFQVDCHYDV